MFCVDLLLKHINYRIFLVFSIHVSMMLSVLLPVWPGHVHFWLIMVGRWGEAWLCRLFGVSLVCWNCFSVVCPKWLGYVAQLIGVAGFQFELPVPGVFVLCCLRVGFLMLSWWLLSTILLAWC